MASEVSTLPLHSKRVQAWVYATVNPLIKSLRGEIHLLGQGNLSWRAYSKRCEYIRPIPEYIESSQRPNFEDFLADQLNPGFKEPFERHDHQVSEVEKVAARFFVGLTDSSEFQNQVKDAVEEYASVARGNPNYPDLGTIRDLAKVVAEYLINRVDNLPDHYMTHKFWEDYRGRFNHYQNPPSFQELDQTAAALHETSMNLLSDLEGHRRHLCVTYDIPAAPIPTDKSHNLDVYVV